RMMIGATNPANSEPGTIRGDLANEVGRNTIHGSDSPESATQEISLWFPDGVNERMPAARPWIYE
ncbi:nucleoside-diphosphate kinase, partial [Enterobacter hormaechei]